MPKYKEKYIHRIGRTGRHGRKGAVVNFILPADEKFMNFVAKFYNININKIPFDLSELEF